MRRVACTLAMLVAAGVAAAGVGATSHAAVARCSTSALRAVSSGSQGAAGTDFAELRFELRRPGRCALGGFPGVTLLDGDARIAVHVARFKGGGKPRTVTLSRGHPAYFAFVYHAFDNVHQRACHVRVSGLRVIPPNERHSLRVTLRPRALTVCRDAGLAVTAVSATAGG
jgi:hypothetical protein